MNGIAGSEVAHPVADVTGTTTDATGLVWTTNGAVTYGGTQTFGLQAYLQVFSFTGTDATVKLQSSRDNGLLDAWVDVTGGGFTQVTSGPTTQRIATSATLPVERYLRAVTTTSAGFTSLVFNVVVNRNVSAVRTS
jgi:hypothetical protein